MKLIKFVLIIFLENLSFLNSLTNYYHQVINKKSLHVNSIPAYKNKKLHENSLDYDDDDDDLDDLDDDELNSRMMKKKLITHSKPIKNNLKDREVVDYKINKEIFPNYSGKNNDYIHLSSHNILDHRPIKNSNFLKSEIIHPNYNSYHLDKRSTKLKENNPIKINENLTESHKNKIINQKIEEKLIDNLHEKNIRNNHKNPSDTLSEKISNTHKIVNLPDIKYNIIQLSHDNSKLTNKRIIPNQIPSINKNKYPIPDSFASKRELNEETETLVKDKINIMEKQLTPVLLKSLIESVVTKIIDEKYGKKSSKILGSDFEDLNESYSDDENSDCGFNKHQKHQKINSELYETPQIVSKEDKEMFQPYYLPFSSKNKTQINNSLKNESCQKDHHLEDVTYVSNLSPESRAKFDFLKSNQNDPEYIKIINSGYENPSFVSPIVENYATNVKPVVKIDQINLDPVFNNWENVEYRNPDNTERKFLTPTHFTIIENTNNSPNPVADQEYGFLELKNEEIIR